MAFYSLFLSFKVQLPFPARAWMVLLFSPLLSIQKVQEMADHMYHLRIAVSLQELLNSYKVSQIYIYISYKCIMHQFTFEFLITVKNTVRFKDRK